VGAADLTNKETEKIKQRMKEQYRNENKRTNTFDDASFAFVLLHRQPLYASKQSRVHDHEIHVTVEDPLQRRQESS
jgi:hypothetical protein